MEHWYNDVDRWKPNYSEQKPIQVTLCLPKIPHGLTWVWNWASGVNLLHVLDGALVSHLSFHLPISIYLWPSLEVCVYTEVSSFTSYPYSDSGHILVTNCPTSRISFPPRSPCIPPPLFFYILLHNATTEPLWVLVHDIAFVSSRGQISVFSCTYAALYCYHQGSPCFM